MQGASDRRDGPAAPKPRDAPTHPSSETVEDGPGHEESPRDAGDASPSPAAKIAPETSELLRPERYEILGEYARGGLGRILKARDRRLDRIVALKELRRDHPVARTRFLREVQITARLQHPNIIPLHEAGAWPTGESVYSMKLVDGKTLAQAIDGATKPVQRFALLPALLDVAEAIAYAHSQRIIHRDLKPANVLVGPFGETVVIDWGLAKALDDDGADALEFEIEEGSPFETRIGAIVGTPAYMPPEQAAGTPVDERADVYALGAMMYHVIAGRSPYAEYEQDEILHRVTAEAPTPLGAIAPEAPPDLVAIVEKAMARLPEDRYPSAREMAQELRRFSNGRLVDAYRYTLWDLGLRFVRRHRAAVITATLAAAALAVFAAMSFRRIAEERDRASSSAVAEKEARGIAERRVDELLVEKARSLVDRDPTLAAAWLKRLVSIPEGAASVAALAEDRGVAARVLRGPTDLIYAIAVSENGERIATGGADKDVRLWNLLTGESRTLEGHTERVTSLAFSPDQQTLASASYDGTVRLWPIAAGASRVLRGHRGPVKALRFSPDGSRLGTVSADGTVRLWESSTFESEPFEAPSDRTLFAAFSGDGTWLLTGSHEGTVHLRNVRTNELRVLGGHAGPINSAATSRNGGLVVTGGEDGTVRIWHRDTNRTTVVHEGRPITSVALSPDEGQLAAGDRNGRVRLFDLATGAVRLVAEHAERVDALVFSPDGRYLASGAWDKTIALLDRETRGVAVLKGHTDVVSAIAFSNNGRLLTSASWDKTARAWSLPGPARAREYKGHTIGVRSVDFSPDGRLLASGGHDNTVRLWDLASHETKTFEGHKDHVYRVLFSPDGQFVASSSDDKSVRLWNVRTGESRIVAQHEADVEEISFSPDGRRLATASEDDTAKVVTLATGAETTLRHDNDVTALSFSLDGTQIATASRDRSVTLWRSTTGERLDVLRMHPDEVWGLQYAPNGKTIASSSVNGTVVLWEPRTGRTRSVTGLPGARNLAFSADGQKIAVAGVAPKLWVCDVLELRCNELHGHHAVVRDMVFSETANVLVSGGGDGTAQVWDLDTRERRVVEGHAAPIFDLALSPDGKSFATASGDAVVRVLPIVPPPVPSNLRRFLDDLTAEVVSGNVE